MAKECNFNFFRRPGGAGVRGNGRERGFRSKRVRQRASFCSNGMPAWAGLVEGSTS